MDLNPFRETLVAPGDLDFLYNTANVFNRATEATVSVTSIASVAARAKHWPDGFIKPGTLLAKHTSGTYNGLWSPFIADQSPNTGLTAVGAMVLTGGHVKRNADGTVSDRVVCSVILASLELQFFLSKLPPLLNNAGANRAPVIGDLSATRWVNMD